MTRVVARLTLDSVWSPPLRNLCLDLNTGLHVVVGCNTDGAATLVDLCAGVLAPRRGRVVYEGREPHSSHQLRRQTASLLANEPGAPGEPPSGWWRRVVSQRSSAPVSNEPPSLATASSFGSLHLDQRRQLALELALSHPAPAVVALHDPLSVPGDVTLSKRAERIAELARSAVVVVTASALHHARMLGGQVYALERGVIARRPPSAWPAALTPGLPVTLRVDCDSPRRLLARLATEPCVELAHYDAKREPRRLQIRGPDLEALSLALCRAAEAANVQVWSLGPASLDLGGLHAASAGLAQAAFREARSGRAGRTEPPSPGSPEPPGRPKP